MYLIARLHLLPLLVMQLLQLLLQSTGNVANEVDNQQPHILHPLHNVTSAEFKALAMETYEKIIPCIESAWMLHDQMDQPGQGQRPWQFPDDALEHYEELLHATEPFRHSPVHEYAGYEGPWIENIFIAKFKRAPLHHFNGLIPLFVQWIDTQILRGHYFDDIFDALSDLLRPNVLYFAVSQGDAGLAKIGAAHPNILVLSAGGFGHVVLPLIKGEIPYSPPPLHYHHDVSFFGTIHQSVRPQMLAEIHAAANRIGLRYKDGYTADWKREMESSRVNLAPRGYGRSSFRFAESIQMGRIPIFLYHDYSWAPYSRTNISVETYGFQAGLTPYKNHMNRTVHWIADLIAKPEEFNRRLEKLKEVRFYFTYPGVVHEITEFLKDPFGPDGGHLRCTTHPKTQLCCW